MAQKGEKPSLELLRWLGILRIGWIAIGAIVGGFVLGYLLDRWLDTWPAFTILLLLLGTVGGFYKAYREIMKLTEDNGPT